jgi:hypothetical protein
VYRFYDTVRLGKYKKWLVQAHALRQLRNTIVHSRWGVDSYGRHVIAVTTPVLVDPACERPFTAEELAAAIETAEQLMRALNRLRKDHPL